MWREPPGGGCKTSTHVIAMLLLAVLALTTVVLAEDESMGPVFVKEPPNRVDFSNGTGAVVECQARGNPQPDIIWVRADGTAVGDVPGLRQVLPNGNLVFPPFRAEDYRQEVHAQVYSCLARSPAGSVHSRDVNVRAVVAQYYDTDVNKEYAIRGNSAILKCVVPSFVADFVKVLSWHTDQGEEFVPSDDFDGKYLVLPSGELHIRDVGPEDGYKTYQCRTKHRLTGETRLSATKGRLVITEPVGFKSPIFSSDNTLSAYARRMGTGVVLACNAQGFPVPTARWYKFIEGTSRRQPVQLNERVRQVSGTLIIREARVEDSGKYLCIVNNSVGGESVETVLTVTAPLNAEIEPSTQTIDFGRPATFTCAVQGNPIKTISWLKDGKPLGLEDRVLRIESVKKEDKGMYQCFVRNDQESAQATAELKLGGRFEPPQIRQAFTEETLQPGPSMFLKCVASGNPTPEITWELDGKRLSNTERLQVGQYVTVNGDVVSHLNISSIHTNDGGLYKCIAASKVGSAEHSARLNVYGLPFIRHMDKKAIVAGETLRVTCPVAGYPIESIVWERDTRVLPINRKQKVFPNGTLIIENVERLSDQATYTCVARNAQGYSARGTLEVQVMVAPHLQPFAFDEANSGDLIIVHCAVVKGDTPISLKWLFEGRHLEVGDGVGITALGDRVSALTIPAVRGEHAGEYACVADNPAGSARHSAHLKVNVLPRINPFDFGDRPIYAGQAAQLACMVPVGDTPIEIAWTHQDKALSQFMGFSVGKLGPRTSILLIEPVTPEHGGRYACIASNPSGRAVHEATLRVHG